VVPQRVREVARGVGRSALFGEVEARRVHGLELVARLLELGRRRALDGADPGPGEPTDLVEVRLADLGEVDAEL